MIALRFLLVGILVLMMLEVTRLIRGPYAADRIVVVNSLTTKICTIILLLAFLQNNFSFIDVVIVFTLCGLVGTIATLRFLLPVNHEKAVAKLADIYAQTTPKD
ncbi:MAG: hypothetical protein GX208_01385 [Firmicutes bacterium]|nr:hypothetical protein [Bacillota bacterium]